MILAFFLFIFQSPIINVPVYIHEITVNRQFKLPEEALNDTIDVLNKAFEGSKDWEGKDISPETPFKFTVVQVEVVRNVRWFISESPCTLGSASLHMEMKRILRHGGPDALNIYITNLEWPYIGCSGTTFEPKDDGIEVSYQAWNNSTTIIHETGHWLGLVNHSFLAHNYMQEKRHFDEDRFTPDQVKTMIDFWNKNRKVDKVK